MKSYYVDPAQLVNTHQGFFRAERLRPNVIIKSLQGIQKVIEVNKVERLVKQITFKNGWTTFIDLKNNVQTDQDLVTAAQVRDGEILKFCFFNYFAPERDMEIEWTDKKMSVPIRIPKKLSADFAYWLGIVAAQSKSGSGQKKIWVELRKDNNLKAVFTALTKRIFNLTVDEVESGGRKFLQINSSNLVQFLHHSIGRKLAFRKVPLFIQEAPPEMQLNFIRGLSIKGHIDEKKFIVYSGSSKPIADFVASTLLSLGFGIYRKVKKNGPKRVFNVIIQYSHPHAENFYSDFLKQDINHNYDVSIDILKDLALPSFHPAYKAYRRAVQRKQRVISAQALLNVIPEPSGEKTKTQQKQYDRLKLANDQLEILMNESFEYFVEVKEVKILKKDMMELVVSSEDGLIIDGLILTIKKAPFRRLYFFTLHFKDNLITSEMWLTG